MNTTKLPSIVLSVLGILLVFVGLSQIERGMPEVDTIFMGTFILSGAILFAAAGIACAISDAGQNSKKDAGN